MSLQHLGRRCAILLATLVAFSCGGDTTKPGQDASTPDAGPTRDIGGVQDVASPPDMTVSEDLTVAPDLGQPVDMSVPVDMQSAADTGPDMAADAGDAGVICIPESVTMFCERASAECGLISDRNNCGATMNVNCGVCATGESCFANTCSCVPELDSLLCQRYTLSCGTAVRTDNCGLTRTVNCGTCTAPATCGGGGTPNVCACGMQTDVDFCASLGANCGPVTGLDTCGQMRSVDCGSCAMPETCGGGGQDNVCGCTSEPDSTFCVAAGATCGALTVVDNCAVERTIDCGACAAPETCGGGGAPNSCGCTPDTDAALCGLAGLECDTFMTTDNCGQSRVLDCGGCTAPEVCAGEGIPNICGCTPGTDAEVCANAGAECGSLTTPDNCGQSRTLDCGTCNTPDVCGGGGGAPNVCVCIPESNVELCEVSRAGCGTFLATDRCGRARSLDCGTCSVGTCDGPSRQCVVKATRMPAKAISDALGVVSDGILIAGCDFVGAVTVDVNITHTYRGDLFIDLVSPTGLRIQLKTDAVDPAADVVGNYPATLTPVQSLNGLQDAGGNGTWRLEVLDAYTSDDGIWNSWGLNLHCY